MGRNVDGEYLECVKQNILSRFCGSQPVGQCIMLEFKRNALIRYLCFVCVSRTISFTPIDFAYNSVWASLAKIRRFRVKNNVKVKWDVVIGSFSSVKNGLPRDVDNIAQQIALAIGHFSQDSTFGDVQSLDSAMEFVRNPRTKSISDLQDELEGLMWSKELDKRGLLSKTELSILIDWVAEEAPNALSSASTLCYLLENQNPYALKSSIISKFISRNVKCLKMMINYISNGKINSYKEISKEQLLIRDRIGVGTSSSVHEATYNDKQVAVKLINDENESELLKEISFLLLLKGSYIIDLIGVHVKNDRFIVIELMEGSLYELMNDKDNVNIPTEIRYVIAMRCAQCMTFFHSCGLIHRDLKSLNILFNSDFEFKLCDFGLSCSMRDKNMTQNIGTVSWIAPEMFSNKNYNQKADVYSFGIMLWEIITGQEPYANLNSMSIPIYVLKGERPPIPKYCDDRYKKLMKKCWDKRPAKRPNFNFITSQLQDLYDSEISRKQSTSEAPLIVKHIVKNSNEKNKTFTITYENGTIEHSLVEISEITTEDDSSVVRSSKSSISHFSDSEMYSNTKPELLFPETSRKYFQTGSDLIHDYFKGFIKDPETGTVQNVFSERHLLLSASTLSSTINDILKKQIVLMNSVEEEQTFTNHFLYEIGLQMGSSDADYVMSLMEEATGIQAVALLPYYLSYTGWSNCDTLAASTLEENNFFWISRHKTTFTKKSSSNAPFGCNIIAGYMAGWCSEALGKTVICVEYHCKCRTNEHCEFAISTKRHLAKKLRSFKKSNPYNYSDELLDAIYVHDFIDEHYSSESWTEEFKSLLNPRKMKKTKTRRKKKKSLMSSEKKLTVGFLEVPDDENLVTIPDKACLTVLETNYLLVRSTSLVMSCFDKMKDIFKDFENPSYYATLFSKDIGYACGTGDAQTLLTNKKFLLQRSKLCTYSLKIFGWGRCDFTTPSSLVFSGTITDTIAEKDSEITTGYLEGFFSYGAESDFCGILTSDPKNQDKSFIISKSNQTTLRHLQSENYPENIIKKMERYPLTKNWLI